LWEEERVHSWIHREFKAALLSNSFHLSRCFTNFTLKKKDATNLVLQHAGGEYGTRAQGSTPHGMMKPSSAPDFL